MPCDLFATRTTLPQADDWTVIVECGASVVVRRTLYGIWNRHMLQTIEGVYEDGRVDLVERPQNVGRARVIVTFLSSPNEPQSNTALPEPPQFTPAELAELRAKVSAWDEDWNAPGMEAYDDL